MRLVTRETVTGVMVGPRQERDLLTAGLPLVRPLGSVSGGHLRAKRAQDRPA